MTLDRAEELFASYPCKENAAALLRTVVEYHGDDMIGDDEFFDTIAGVIEWLEK